MKHTNILSMINGINMSIFLAILVVFILNCTSIKTVLPERLSHPTKLNILEDCRRKLFFELLHCSVELGGTVVRDWSANEPMDAALDAALIPLEASLANKDEELWLKWFGESTEESDNDV